MSHTLSNLITCPTIQDRLNGYFAQYDPALILEPVPLIEFLTSPTNTANTLQNQISAGNGKVRSIELVYESRLLEDEVSTSAVKACSSSNEGGQKSETYEIDVTTGSEINQKFTLTNLAEICEADENYIMRQIAKMMDAAIRKMATTTWTQLTSLTGVFADGVTGNTDAFTVTADDELQVQTKKSNGDIDTNFIENISFATRDALYPTIPYLFGYGETHLAFRRVKAGCCATSGLDVGAFAQQNDMVFLSDYRAEAALGTNKFVSLAAGALQLLTYNEFVGPKGIRVVDDESYKQTVIRHPLTGIPFDMIWKNDCGNIHVQIKVAHKLVGMPNDMFFGGDRLEGVTLVNKYKIVNP